MVHEAIELGVDQIYICEGEKDCDNGREAYGIVTTTNSGGAGQWKAHHSEQLRAAEIVNIIWDKDDPGRKHAWVVHDSLWSVGVRDIRFWRAREGNDLTDHINANYKLNELVKATPRRVVEEEQETWTVDGGEKPLPGIFQLALLKLAEYGPVILQTGGEHEHQYYTCCPAHDDRNPSMSIRPGVAGKRDGVAVLVECHAGCTAKAIALALGIDPKDFTEIEQTEEDQQARETAKQVLYQKARAEATKIILNENRNVELVEFTRSSTSAQLSFRSRLSRKFGWCRIGSGIALG